MQHMRNPRNLGLRIKDNFQNTGAWEWDRPLPITKYLDPGNLLIFSLKYPHLYIYEKMYTSIE